MKDKDKKELDAVLQIVMPDDYYEDMRKLLIPYLIKWHETKVKKLSKADVIKSVCEHKHKTKIGFGISDSICDDCGERIKQTVL